MCERILVAATLLTGELAGAFIQLRRHLGGFFGWTAERNQGFGQFRYLHKKVRTAHRAAQSKTRPRSSMANINHFTASAGTILMLMIPMRLLGRSCGCVGVVPIFSSTSSPLISLPKVVY